LILNELLMAHTDIRLKHSTTYVYTGAYERHEAAGRSTKLPYIS